jgi:hypothetical protein
LEGFWKVSGAFWKVVERLIEYNISGGIREQLETVGRRPASLLRPQKCSDSAE